MGSHRRAGGPVVLVGAESEENLALRYLGAAVAAAGRPVHLTRFDADDPPEAVAGRALALKPVLLGLSLAFQAHAPRFLALAARLREEGYTGHLTVGGQFATVAARRLLELSPALDSVVRGEGEETLVELAAALENGCDLSEIPGITFRNGTTVETPPRPAREDLDRLSLPLRTPPFTRQAGLPVASMLGSRGCLQGCTYCSIQTFGRQRPGSRRRERNVEAMADEMATLYREHGVRIFIFHDDNFLRPTVEASRERAEAFRDAVLGRGLDRAAVVIKIRPDIVTQPVIAPLREAGLVRAYVGIESGNPHGLKVLGRGQSVAAGHAALRVFEDLGVFACYNMLSFHPETRLEEVREDVAFARAHPTVPFNVGRVEIYTGTPLDRWLRRQRRLFGPELAPVYRIADPRAELASRIVGVVFHRRAYHIHGLLNGASSLGYEPAAMGRARPDLKLDELSRDVGRFEVRLHADTCGLLERACRIAAANPRGERLRAEVSELAWETARRDADLEGEMAALRARLKRSRSPAGEAPAVL